MATDPLNSQLQSQGPDRHQSGFTLVELMITIGLVAIMGLWAIPSFNQFLVNNRLINTVNGIVSGCNYAKSEAISRGTGVSICASNGSTTAPSCSGNNDWSQGFVIYTDSNLNGVLDGADTLLRTHAPFGGTPTITADSIDTVVFTDEGFLETGDGNIDICTNFDDRRITINNNGSIRLTEDPDCS